MRREAWNGGWRMVGAALLSAEGALLGRGVPDRRRALDEAIAIVGGGAWCDRCGATLPTVSVTGALGDGGGFAPLFADGSRASCPACRDAGAFEGFVRLGRYEPPLDRLVRGVKRRAMHALACEIGMRLGVEARMRLAQPLDGWSVVPIPGHFGRRLARGIDHAHAIARGVACAVQGRVVRALRMRAAGRQAGLDRNERLGRDARLALRPRVARPLVGRSVLLVDDIRTTGATLTEARELLLKAGVVHIAAAVACVTDRTQEH